MRNCLETGFVGTTSSSSSSPCCCCGSASTRLSHLALAPSVGLVCTAVFCLSRTFRFFSAFVFLFTFCGTHTRPRHAHSAAAAAAVAAAFAFCIFICKFVALLVECICAKVSVCVLCVCAFEFALHLLYFILRARNTFSQFASQSSAQPPVLAFLVFLGKTPLNALQALLNHPNSASSLSLLN